ncbi:beta/gamma crystallin-related protein [Hyphomonas chukchiensis]|uniref:Beta/gamma crystallin 'Greek key' domain-containing protein n=1 Tax=Hyphomonas chukchiensis TaxID=1280947 RepID=A0A062UEJ5_9PROT|nr:beta/gamma crystallin-related protein [Hyphomonas chukchiensis]KCZ60014.1 hypothetical protein HY30_13365 [Hyphomonas chukchiensis]|tara:strand:+ start:490 stop:1206 length:717 start_codon:yes stop_codon:yes gene_type:complete
MNRLTHYRNGALVAATIAALALPAQAAPHRDAYRGGHGGVVLHADGNFRGEAIEVNGAVPDLSRVRFNDRVSSISIGSGIWEVCSDANFKGRCATIDTSVSRLGDLRLNDNISSIRPVGYGRGGVAERGRWNGGYANGGADVVLFSRAGMSGEQVGINRDIADLSAYRFNDKASSILVTQGTWLACEHANYKGRCEVVSRGSGDLRPIGLNDNISSIRRYDSRYEAHNDYDRHDGWRR